MKKWLYILTPVILLAVHVFYFAYWSQHSMWLSASTGIFRLFAYGGEGFWVAVTAIAMFLASLFLWYRFTGWFSFIVLAITSWILGPGTGLLLTH